MGNSYGGSFALSYLTMILEHHSAFLYAIAGIAMFMHGMGLASESLQKLAANRLRDLMVKLSDNPFLGVVVGVVLTVLIQSSGAVTSMLVGLGSAGVVTLSQVMAVILGSAIGTTLTVQLLSLNITEYGMPLFAFSFIVYFLTSKRAVRLVSAVVMGFGLIFWGLELIGWGTSELREAQFFMEFIDHLKMYPLLTVLVAAFFTAVVHSSAVTIGFAMSLAGAGLIDLSDAIYWVYGANLGTTATALVASAGGNYIGRQVAWANFFFKVVGVVIFYFATDLFAGLISSGAIGRDIANAHTIFNIVTVFAFFFFIKLGVRFITTLIPPKDKDKAFSVKYLNRSGITSSSVAIAHAQREVMRMGDIVISMIKDSIHLFENEDVDLEDSIRERDNRVDLLTKEINLFIARCLDENEGGEQELMRIMSLATDLESVGDVIDNSLLHLSVRKHNLKLDFSSEGWADIKDFFDSVVPLAQMSMTCYQLKDEQLASKVIYHKRALRKKERLYRERHMERLVGAKTKTINTSSIHLDVLSDYRRIVGLMANHVYIHLKDNDKYNIYPRGEGRES